MLRYVIAKKYIKSVGEKLKINGPFQKAMQWWKRASNHK